MDKTAVDHEAKNSCARALDEEFACDVDFENIKMFTDACHGWQLSNMDGGVISDR